MKVEDLAKLIDPEGRPRTAGAGRLQVRCVAHEDETPSLTIWIDDRGKAAFNCHAGCPHDAIVRNLPPQAKAEVEATWNGSGNVRILVPTRRHKPSTYEEPVGNVEAEYPYHDHNGTVQYVVRRFPGKRLRQFHPGQAGGLVSGRGDSDIYPYRLPDVLAAKEAGDLIYVVEGEKDADTLAAHGMTATTNLGGATKWTEDINPWFKDARVVILPDNDEPGQRHAAEVLDHLSGVAAEARILILPGLPDKGDVTDWLEDHQPEELEQLAHQTVEEPEPAEFRVSPGDLIFSIPLEVESIWGKGPESLWAYGEPLMIYGPTGIGKTTLAGRLLLSLIGVDPSELLGYPINAIPAGKTVLYIAADRPRQAMRSLRRMTPREAASVLAERLRIEHHRQIWASEKDPEMIYRAAVQTNAAIVFIDSSKDLAGGPLKEEGPAKALMDSVQICVANDIDVAMLHHPRKSIQEGNNQRELDLDDVYGSAWLTAGQGSVLLVDGKPGSGEFRFTQLKAPATFIDPLEVTVEYETGVLHKNTIRDIETWLKGYGMPVTVKQAVCHQYGMTEDDVDYESPQYRKMAKRLKELVAQGVVSQTQTNPLRYQWAGPMKVTVGGQER